MSVHRGVPGRGACLLCGGLLWGDLVLGGCLFGGVPAPGGCLLRGGAWWRPPTATAAGGTHPTGMHSCYVKRSRCT